MVTYAEVESAVRALEFSAAPPRECLEALKIFDRRIQSEGSDVTNLKPTVRKMMQYCVGEILTHRAEMLKWLDENFDRIQKRKAAKEREAKRGQINMLEF